MTDKTIFKAIFFAFIAVPLMTSAATAQNNYFSWKIGTSQMELDNINGLDIHSTDTVANPTEEDDVTTFSVAYGHKSTDSVLPLRMEIELTLRGAVDYSSDPAFVGDPHLYGPISSDINSHTLFANLYLDLLPSGSSIVPYVGGGGGLVWNVWDFGSWWEDDTETTTSLGWNVCGGVAFQLNRHLMIDASYRYVDFGDAEIPGVIEINDITANEAQLGLRLVF